MMSLTFGLFTQVSGSGPLGPVVLMILFCRRGLDNVSCIQNMAALLFIPPVTTPPPPKKKNGFGFIVKFTYYRAQNQICKTCTLEFIHL